MQLNFLKHESIPALHGTMIWQVNVISLVQARLLTDSLHNEDCMSYMD
uniref:Uncharacterized protein n=1 Tax=Rhizophora mucronata TaxID=61149 RepID=A0A2P2N0F1_RHIMU